MKKFTINAAIALVLAGSMLNTSCIGSFGLTNKLMSWNKNVSNKFVNELIFVCFWILPVYEVTALADLLVLNSIEFWSGNSPMAKGKKLIDGKEDRYLVECDGKGYTITAESDGSVVRLDFDTDDRSWSVTTDDTTVKLMSFIDDEHVKILDATGGYRTVELTAAGVLAYQNSVSAHLMANK